MISCVIALREKNWSRLLHTADFVCPVCIGCHFTKCLLLKHFAALRYQQAHTHLSTKSDHGSELCIETYAQVYLPDPWAMTNCRFHRVERQAGYGWGWAPSEEVCRGAEELEPGDCVWKDIIDKNEQDNNCGETFIWWITRNLLPPLPLSPSSHFLSLPRTQSPSLSLFLSLSLSLSLSLYLCLSLLVTLTFSPPSLFLAFLFLLLTLSPPPPSPL